MSVYPGLPGGAAYVASSADIAVHVDAARAGLHSAAMDILEVMKRAGVKDAEAAILSGSIEMAVEVWTKTMFQMGVPSDKVFAGLMDQVRILFEKYRGQ